jgi:hypothetical protein
VVVSIQKLKGKNGFNDWFNADVTEAREIESVLRECRCLSLLIDGGVCV